MNEKATDTESIRRLLAEAAEIPRSIEPPRDLWPEIAGRLVERRPAAVLAGTWRRWAYQAVAAILFMALGALLALVLRPATASSPEATTAQLSPGEVLPASATGASEFAKVEAEYLRAKDQLWLLALSRRDDLSPVAMRVVERNLRIIEAAIRDLRGVLDSDPENRQIEGLLLAKHRQGIEILQRLTGPPAKT